MISVFLLLVIAGCANIVSPSGGPRDVSGPSLVEVSPADSLTNTRVGVLKLRFDEYISLSDLSQIQISPLLRLPLSISSKYKTVTVKIADSLFQHNTTYTISFGNAIKDLHENNPFGNYTYLFSTGAYFDSLEVNGQVINAATGLPDTSAKILLYEATVSDSAVVREKPMYVSSVNSMGGFSVKGLPARPFRLYALRDANDNLTYDGDEEWIAFLAELVMPGDSMRYELRLFPGDVNAEDSAKTKANPGMVGGKRQSRSTAEAAQSARSIRQSGPLSVSVDTTAGGQNRSQELSKPLELNFLHPPSRFDSTRVFLSMEQNGIPTEVAYTAHRDTVDSSKVLVRTAWKEDQRYELRLQKGFAKDSSGNDYLPGIYAFRTKREADYAKLQVHLPSVWYGSGFLLQVSNGVDTLYQLPITDTNFVLERLPPASYTLRVIHDRNGNGRWDTGEVLRKEQPEEVIPYPGTIMLKAGWENRIDFLSEKKNQKR